MIVSSVNTLKDYEAIKVIENNGKPPPVSTTPAMMVNQTLCVSGKRNVDRTDILEPPSGLAFTLQSRGWP